MADRFLLAGTADDCLLLAGTTNDCLLLGVGLFDGGLDDVRLWYRDAAGVQHAIDQHVVGPIRVQVGIRGTRPRDRVASTGTLRCELADEAGRFTPPAADGFRRGVLIGLDLRPTPGDDYTRRFTGWVAKIDPPTDPHGPRVTAIEAADWFERAGTVRVRPPVQRDRRPDELTRTAIAAMPAEARPYAEAGADYWDAAVQGSDRAAFAFHEVRDGVPVRTLLQRAMLAELGYLWVEGSGRLRFMNRLGRTTSTRREWTIAEGDVAPGGVRVTDALADAYTRIEAVVHPIHVDQTVRVLHDLTDRPTIEAGESLRLFAPFLNPDVGGQPIGGFDLGGHTVTAEHGDGTDASAAITLTAAEAGGTAIVDLRNTGAAAATITALQIRGRGVYDLTPVTVVADEADQQGADVQQTRTVRVDLRYVAQPERGRTLADILRRRHASTAMQVQQVEIPGARSAAMTGLLARVEGGDMATISVPQVGRGQAATVYGVDLRIDPTRQIRGTLRVGPAHATTPFEVGRSTIGGPDVLG